MPGKEIINSFQAFSYLPPLHNGFSFTDRAAEARAVLTRNPADHLLREPVETVQTAGFSIEYLKRQKLGIVERLIARKASQ